MVGHAPKFASYQVFFSAWMMLFSAGPTGMSPKAVDIRCDMAVSVVVPLLQFGWLHWRAGEMVDVDRRATRCRAVDAHIKP